MLLKLLAMIHKLNRPLLIRKFPYIEEKKLQDICHLFMEVRTMIWNVLLLIHPTDPQSRPVMIIVFAHVVRPTIRTSLLNWQNLSKQSKNFKRKQCSLLATLCPTRSSHFVIFCDVFLFDEGCHFSSTEKMPFPFESHNLTKGHHRC